MIGGETFLIYKVVYLLVFSPNCINLGFLNTLYISSPFSRVKIITSVLTNKLIKSNTLAWLAFRNIVNNLKTYIILFCETPSDALCRFLTISHPVPLSSLPTTYWANFYLVEDN